MSGMLEGLPPVIDPDCRVLILGSFPSVKSRGVFFYNNPQNRFWHVLGDVLGRPAPAAPSEKRDWLLGAHIALTDIVARCDIVGSLDADIRIADPAQIADVPSLLRGTRVHTVFCNGGKAFSLTRRFYPGLDPVPLPSTSPANVRFDRAAWDAIARALAERKPPLVV